MSGFDDNDISALLTAFDPLFLVRISMCQLSVEDMREIARKLGKVEINIGDGLTLLHQAASHNRPDLVEYLCDQGHSTEVKTIHGICPDLSKVFLYTRCMSLISDHSPP